MLLDLIQKYKRVQTSKSISLRHKLNRFFANKLEPSATAVGPTYVRLLPEGT